MIAGLICCGQTMNPEKEKAAIAAFRNQMYDKIIPYQPRPFYTAQVNKNNCRVTVLINGIPYWQTFFENYGQTQGLYINDYIQSSGLQELTIQIYPKEKEKTIALNADVDIKINYAKDRDDGINTYLQLAKVKLSESIKRLELPYYELKIPFEAQVPWDHSEGMERAKDLKEIPDIEEKILAKANQIHNLLVAGDAIAYLKEIEQSDLKAANKHYFKKEELLQAIAQSNPDGWDRMARTHSLKKRIVYPIENYELVFSHNNKIVLVRKKDTKGSILEVNNDGRITDRALFLYMPEGSDELKVW